MVGCLSTSGQVSGNLWAVTEVYSALVRVTGQWLSIAEPGLHSCYC